MNPNAYGGRGAGRNRQSSRQSGGMRGGGGGGGKKTSSCPLWAFILIALPIGAVITGLLSAGVILSGCEPLQDPPRPTEKPTVMYTVILPLEGAASPDGGIYDNN